MGAFLRHNVQVMTEPALAAQSQQAQSALAQLSEEFFEVVHTADPFGTTQVGAPGFDALVPDPSRAGAARGAQRIARIEERLSRIDPALVDQAGRVNHAVLAHLAWAARSDLEHGLWEANASAGGYVSPQAMVFMSVPAALLDNAAAVDGYLQRLRGLGGYFDAVTARYSQARQDEWAELGGKVLQVTDVPAIHDRLREDRSPRFADSGQIARTVTAALQRAEQARDRWFPRFDIPECVIEEIDPVEAGNAPLAYYRPPAAGGKRPSRRPGRRRPRPEPVRSRRSRPSSRRAPGGR
jgi:hypothetical protein